MIRKGNPIGPPNDLENLFNKDYLLNFLVRFHLKTKVATAMLPRIDCDIKPPTSNAAVKRLMSVRKIVPKILDISENGPNIGMIPCLLIFRTSF